MGNDLPAVALGTGRTATAVVAGEWHTCALLDGGDVKCWGGNNFGQLGSGDTAPRGGAPGEMGDNLPLIALGAGRHAVALAAGLAQTCALLDNASVKCWGMNGYGQLGLGDTNNRGDEPGEMGDALPAVALGARGSTLAVSAGYTDSCALLDNHSVKCWGEDSGGGFGFVVAHGDEPGEMGDSLPPVALGEARTASLVKSGFGISCALLDDAAVHCWYGNDLANIEEPSWLSRAAGEFGTGRSAVSIAVGVRICALLDNGAVKCWGQPSPFAPAVERGDAWLALRLPPGRRAAQIESQYGHACAVLDNGAVTCWGNNGNGQLGVGDLTPRTGLEANTTLQPVDLGS
jgi:hypothetical protein